MERAASIFLRADIRPQDGHNMIRWVENKNVTRYLHESRYVADEIRTLLEQTPPHLLTYHFNRNGQFYLVCKEDGDSIGFVKLLRLPDGRCEVVYVIGEESLWGHGLGRQTLKLVLNKAFFENRASAVIAKIHTDNLRSIRTAVHCGMRVFEERERLTVYSVSMETYLKKLRETPQI